MKRARTKPSQVLPIPSVDEAVSDLLPVTSTKATVVVPATANLRANDLLTVTWKGVIGAGTVTSFPLVIDAGGAGKAYRYTIKANAIAANANRTVEVGYHVLRASDGTSEASETYLVGIRSDAPPDPLTIDTTTLILSTTFPTQGHQASGGVAPYVYSSSNDAVVKVTDTARGILQAVGYDSANIAVQDSATPSHAVGYSVRVISTKPLTIDTDPLVLPDTNPTQGHQASGASGTYVYSSSNASIVKVIDPTRGIVQAVAEGGVIISARDGVTPSLSVSYEVYVEAFMSETFDAVRLGSLPRTLDIGTMVIILGSAGEASIHEANKTHLPFVSGRSLKSIGFVTTRLQFSDAMSYVKFGFSALSASGDPVTIEARDSSDEVISKQTVAANKDHWIVFSSTGGRKIAAITHYSGNSGSQFDNFTLKT